MIQRCQLLAGIVTTTPNAALLNIWIRPDHNHRQPSSAGKAAKAESQTLIDWVNRVIQTLVALASKPERQLLDWAHTVLRENLQLFWEPEAGGGLSDAASQRCSVMAERGLDLAEEPTVVSIHSLRAKGSVTIYLAADSRGWRGRSANAPTGGDVSPKILVRTCGVVLATKMEP